MLKSIIKGNQNTTRLISELKKAAKQYPTLKKYQEDELIKTYANNREKLNHLLFMHNVRLVFNIAKKYMGKTDDFDSMIQDGMHGLAIAAKNFDITRGVKFITYATPWVRKKVLERFYNKANEVIKRSVSLNSPSAATNTKINDGNETDFESYVSEYIDPIAYNKKTIRYEISNNEQTQLCANLYQTLENNSELSSTEKNVFIDAFYNKEKTSDIARKYKLETKDISTIKEKVLDIMRLELKNNYGINSYSDIYDN